MKAVAFAVACLLAISGAVAQQSCYRDVTLECGNVARTNGELNLPGCTAIYGNYSRFGNVAIEMQAYATLHLERSFEYLLSSAYFNNYQTNRDGFSKLFRKLSDDAWENSIELIKHITERGDSWTFTKRTSHRYPINDNNTLELHELHALARALDTQKEIAERAFHIHREAARNLKEMHDPEITQYLEEKFIEKHPETIRKLAGYATDLKSFVISNRGQDLSLSLYLFDNYLSKQV